MNYTDRTDRDTGDTNYTRHIKYVLVYAPQVLRSSSREERERDILHDLRLGLRGRRILQWSLCRNGLSPPPTHPPPLSPLPPPPPPAPFRRPSSHPPLSPRPASPPLCAPPRWPLPPPPLLSQPPRRPRRRVQCRELLDCQSGVRGASAIIIATLFSLSSRGVRRHRRWRWSQRHRRRRRFRQLHHRGRRRHIPVGLQCRRQDLNVVNNAASTKVVLSGDEEGILQPHGRFLCEDVKGVAASFALRLKVVRPGRSCCQSAVPLAAAPNKRVVATCVAAVVAEEEAAESVVAAEPRRVVASPAAEAASLAVDAEAAAHGRAAAAAEGGGITGGEAPSQAELQAAHSSAGWPCTARRATSRWRSRRRRRLWDGPPRRRDRTCSSRVGTTLRLDRRRRRRWRWRWWRWRRAVCVVARHNRRRRRRRWRPHWWWRRRVTATVALGNVVGVSQLWRHGRRHLRRRRSRHR